MSAVLIALFVSLAGCLVLIRYQHLHKHVTGDTDLKGIQKFHINAVPRIGGVPIIIAASSTPEMAVIARDIRISAMESR